MKKSMLVFCCCMGLVLLWLPFIWREISRGKEDIRITQEILAGDPEAARGVTLGVASHWDRQLLWDTELTIGSGQEAESVFTYSPRKISWYRTVEDVAEADFLYASDYGTGITHSPMVVCADDMPYPCIAQAVMDHTAAGEVHVEAVRIGDYYAWYPVSFEITGNSVEYLGDYGQALAYLMNLFQIPVSEDMLEITVEKDQEGNVISLVGRKKAGFRGSGIADASAFGEDGCYYTFCMEEADTGRRMDLGENGGIFYLPFVREKSWLQVDLTGMEKVCGLPGGAVPQGMLLEEEKGYLYLVAGEGTGYSLLVYSLEAGIPVLRQQIFLGQEMASDTGETAWDGLYLEDLDLELEMALPEVCAVQSGAGGLLVTWSDNRFSFVTEEDGQYELWCSGRFPGKKEGEYVWTGREGWSRVDPFPREQECLFDGERLVLAAFEGWDTLDVLLAVYGREGERYAGRYRHSGAWEDALYGTGPFQTGILPQGRDSLAYFQENVGGQVTVQDTGEAVEVLRLHMD